MMWNKIQIMSRVEANLSGYLIFFKSLCWLVLVMITACWSCVNWFVCLPVVSAVTSLSPSEVAVGHSRVAAPDF